MNNVLSISRSHVAFVSAYKNAISVEECKAPEKPHISEFSFFLVTLAPEKKLLDDFVVERERSIHYSHLELHSCLKFFTSVRVTTSIPLSFLIIFRKIRSTLYL